MERYDPDTGPDPGAWLALDEQRRIDLAEEAHQILPRGHPMPRARHAHAIFHTLAENQIAADDPPETGRTLTRLVEEGLGRHDAVHAVASVVAEETHAMLTEKRSFDLESMRRKLAALSAASWRRSAES